MTEQRFIRARSAANKAARADEILRAAARVLERDGIDGTTLAGIAAEAGVVKSGIYRYFESREEILIRILADDVVELVDAILAGIEAAAPDPDRFDTLAEIVARECAARARFCMLLTHMAPILETNISVPKLIAIKRGFLVETGRMSAALLARAPALGPDGAEFAVRVLPTLVAGLWPVATPGPHVAEALQAPDLEPFRTEFGPVLARAFGALLAGLGAAAR